MDSYNFNPPIPLDDDCCSDCGILMESGSGICEYCNKRYQQEAILAEQFEEPFSDEDTKSILGE